MFVINNTNIRKRALEVLRSHILLIKFTNNGSEYFYINISCVGDEWFKTQSACNKDLFRSDFLESLIRL